MTADEDEPVSYFEAAARALRAQATAEQSVRGVADRLSSSRPPPPPPPSPRKDT